MPERLLEVRAQDLGAPPWVFKKEYREAVRRLCVLYRSLLARELERFSRHLRAVESEFEPCSAHLPRRSGLTRMLTTLRRLF